MSSGVLERLSSLDLYLNFGAERIVETRILEDVGGGIYPCYYMTNNCAVRVSTSVTSLIADSGTFEPDGGFKEIDFLGEHVRRSGSWFRIRRKLSRTFGFPNPQKQDPWYASWHTIDRRIKKLGAFETVTPEGSSVGFEPDFSLRDSDVIVDRSARLMTWFIQDVERSFADCEHVILTGGRDSQLISLVPKRQPRNWHVFSADPNYPLVLEWLERNRIPTNRVFRHDNRNEESLADATRKIVCGDLYSDPSHIRWMPAMVEIAAEFDGKCIFWGGTMSSPAHVYCGHYFGDFSEDKYGFFRSHFEQTASWQGNYHQVFKNFTSLPYLSPYHSAEIWEEVYRHLDPSAIQRDTDLREALGERLLGRPVWWDTSNPSPGIYVYSEPINGPRIYRRYINQLLSRHGDRPTAYTPSRRAARSPPATGSSGEG